MDNMEIPELSKEAKRLGLRSYSRLRKQELIEKIQRDWLLKSERLSIFLMKKFRWTSINQFSNQKKIRKGSGNPNNRYRKRKTRKGKQRNRGDAWIEGRSTGSQPRRRPFTNNKNIKSRGSRARKKNQRDQGDKQKPPQISNGGNSQRIGSYEETIYNYKQRTRFWSQRFYAKSETVSLEADERKSPENN